MPLPSLLVAALLGAPVSPTLTPPGDWPAGACEEFQGFDQDGDGRVEIRRLNLLRRAGAGDRGVLVLVEDRLTGPLEGTPDLVSRVERLVQDLGAEGWRAAAVTVGLAPADQHQDGRYVLALREFLRAAHRDVPLDAVLLVGHFPDAFLVRTCSWRRREDVVLHQGTDQERRYADVPWVRRVPEDVAHRADVVLGDLDGNWEDLYVQPRTRLPVVKAVFPGGVPPHGGPCADVERSFVEFEDFFHLSDGKLEVAEHPREDGEGPRFTVTLFDRSGDHECSDEDRRRPNALARPELTVSRIDARGTAWRPRRDLRGADGAGLLDAAGRPQAVTFAEGQEPPHWRSGIWEPDPALERRLLAEYLDRNHAWRTGAAAVAWRPASLSHDLGSGYRVMRRAAPDWVDEDPEAADVSGRPGLAEVAAWLRLPAVLRTLRAHSDPWGSAFSRGDVAPLERDLGGPPWAWTPVGRQLVPSLQAAAGGGKLDWFLLRSLYEYGAVAPEPCLYHHTGCHGISPPGAKTRPYDHPSYGARQGAEALLFFGSGLALVGRAKVFYDEPRGFAEVLADGGTFGQAWTRYYELESQAPTWEQAGGDIGRKRSYFWSVLGDGTLRLVTARPAPDPPGGP